MSSSEAPLEADAVARVNSSIKFRRLKIFIRRRHHTQVKVARVNRLLEPVHTSVFNLRMVATTIRSLFSKALC